MPARRVIRISKFGPLCPAAAQFVEVPAPWCYPEARARQKAIIAMPVTPHDGCDFPPEGRALPRDVKVAIDYMRQNIGRPIRTIDLLAVTGASERTLRKHF